MNGVNLSAGVTRMLSAETAIQRQRFKTDLQRRADKFLAFKLARGMDPFCIRRGIQSNGHYVVIELSAFNRAYTQYTLTAYTVREALTFLQERNQNLFKPAA